MRFICDYHYFPRLLSTLINLFPSQGLSDCSQKPDLVHPDISKLDLTRLLADLPKYKPWLSPSAWCDWEKFMSSTDSLNSVADVPWDMQKLISSAIKSSSSRSTRQAQLSEGLSNILTKEKMVPKKVCMS